MPNATTKRRLLLALASNKREGEMLYFSYGSNMSSKRLKDRVPSACYITIATLIKHELRFHKKSMDGSSKCDAYETGAEEHKIIGVVFEVSDAEKPELDIKEGLGKGYDEKLVNLVTQSGDYIEATTYYATNIDKNKKPYHWYKQHVINGAEEFGLPEEYIDIIRNTESITDNKHSRHELELSIYANK